MAGRTVIMIAHRLTADEALALLVEPTSSNLFDLDDPRVEEASVVCRRDGHAVVCDVPSRTAVRIDRHRVGLEFRDGGLRDGRGWFVSIRGRARALFDAPFAADRDEHAGVVVSVRVSPESVRASRFDAVGRSARPGPESQEVAS